MNPFRLPVLFCALIAAALTFAGCAPTKIVLPKTAAIRDYYRLEVGDRLVGYGVHWIDKAPLFGPEAVRDNTFRRYPDENMEIRTSYVYDPDGTIRNYTTDIAIMDQGRRHAQHIEGNPRQNLFEFFSITTAEGVPTENESNRIAQADFDYFAFDTSRFRGIERNGERTVRIFDPLTFAVNTFRIHHIGRDTFPGKGDNLLCDKFTERVPGDDSAQTEVWIEANTGRLVAMITRIQNNPAAALLLSNAEHLKRHYKELP